MERLRFVLWCCTRVAVSMQFWPFLWWLGTSCGRDENTDYYSLHLGPLTFKVRCRFWPDGEEKPESCTHCGYLPGS